MPSVPQPPAPNLEALERITGQSAVRDYATAERLEFEARGAVSTTRTALERASKVVIWSRLRELPARMNVPAWVVGLVIGSAAAMALCLPMIFALGARIGFLLITISFSYAMGARVFWFLRDEPGDTSDNRAERHRARLSKALAMRNAAAASLERYTSEWNAARLLLIRFREISTDELTRLLAVEPGRLYPDEFERFLVDVLRFLGYTASHTGKSGDQGMDVVAEREGKRIAIQAKRYSTAVGNEAVQQVFTGMFHHGCQVCAVVTTSSFTSSARELAESTGCILIEGTQIPDLIRGRIEL